MSDQNSHASESIHVLASEALFYYCTQLFVMAYSIFIDEELYQLLLTAPNNTEDEMWSKNILGEDTPVLLY